MKIPDEVKKESRELGEHIFRWGLSCEDCTPEDFKIEMAKAVKQLTLAILSAEKRGYERGHADATISEKKQYEPKTLELPEEIW